MPKPYLSTHIVHITDTTDRNAELKVASAYALHQGRLGIRHAMYSFAPAPNTLDIGVVASELVNNTQRADRLILAVNCAPPDKKEGTQNNARNDFFCAELKDNVFISGTSNGYEFSYLRDNIKEMYRLTNTNSLGSQFRSLEILPEHALAFSDPKRRKDLIAGGILERVDIDSIVQSAPRDTHVIEVDNFKNLKLAPSVQDLALLRAQQGKGVVFHFSQGAHQVTQPKRTARSKVTNIANGAEAIVAPTLFAAPLGTNVVALKSSSRLSGERHVPIIATIREKPAETPANYPVPNVGTLVRFSTKPQALAAG